MGSVGQRERERENVRGGKKFIALHQDAAMAVVKEMKVTAISQLDEGNSCSCNLQSKKSLPKPLKPPLKKSKD